MQPIAKRILSAILIASLCLSAASTPAGEADLATEWNETVLMVAEAEDAFLTLKGLRTVAMMHIAMHDALTAIQGGYQTYAFEESAPTADPIAAASTAALTVAATQYPDQSARLGELNDRWLNSIAASDAKRTGVELGRSAAKTILAEREGDGWDGEAEYSWHPMAPGVYAEFEEHSGTPQGFIFGAGWANARGFALKSADQFRAPPPPDIASDDYTRAFNEVKTVGRFQSMSRSPDQTHIALWWKDFGESSFNRLARDLIDKEALSLHEAARLFALINMAIYDGYISSFENKFHYNHWRPYTAIRWAANDGNPDTAPEATWTNTHRHTYAFPSYPSAHGTSCASAMSVFDEVFGSDYAFTMQTPVVDVAGPFSGKIEMHPPTRDFQTFSEAAMQCGLSRIYLGIHFRYDSVEGVRLGGAVGGNVVSQKLRAIE